MDKPSAKAEGFFYGKFSIYLSAHRIGPKGGGREARRKLYALNNG